MTTIVVSRKQGVMIGDTRVSSDGEDPIISTKVFKVGNKLVGFAGTVTHGLKFVAWLKTGIKPEYIYDKDDNSFAALVFDGKSVLYFDKELTPIPIRNDPYAIGSGAAYAMGALSAGASLQRAVEIAALHDVGTALPLTIKRLKKP